MTVTGVGAPFGERLLGERGFLTGLIDHATSRGLDGRAVRTLSRGSVYLAPDDAMTICRAFERILEAVGEDVGWQLHAWSNDGTRSCVRAFVPTSSPSVLLGTPTSAVAVMPEGLWLRLRGLTVLGWRREQDRMVLYCGRDERSVRNTSITAALLHRLARGCQYAALRRRPLAGLAAPVLYELQTAAALAADRALPVRIGSRPGLATSAG